MDDVPPTRAVAAMEFLDGEIEAGRIDVYRSVLNVPYIVFKNHEQLPYPLRLDDRQVREFLTDLMWQRGQRGSTQVPMLEK